MTELFIHLHDLLGETGFLLISLSFAGIICFWCIPETTDYMVNAAAGLAGLYWGRDKRTLVINSSTNNPELFSMIIAFSLGRMGGIANPLGSNFANIYLMFLIAPFFAIIKWALTGKLHNIKKFIALSIKEKNLWLWHIIMSFTMFCFASLAYWCITGANQFKPLPLGHPTQPSHTIFIGGILCLVGMGVFFFFENKLKAKRIELYEDIDEQYHHPSWRDFFLGTVGLISSCYVLNSLFLAWSELYSTILQHFFGAAIFAGLHYFLGALITSLPEMTVAVENYERLTPPDLNTAMASASQSNMTNLAIAAIGSILASILLFFGFHYQL
ncbi:MAG: hypothetical protein J7647_27790 [Cyanobacteria bacterium SBLK]|nr:hypothetical protein [Cyanobacteria bacterium SBLK]